MPVPNFSSLAGLEVTEKFVCGWCGVGSKHPCIKGKPTQYLSLGQTAGTNMFPHLFFSIKNFIWPPDPLNKGKIDFLLQI